MGDSKDMLKKATRWCGLVSALLTTITGIVYICTTNAKIRWPSGSFTDDINGVLWRDPLFTFMPETFLDIWTPLFFGLVGMAVHFKDFKFEIISANFFRYFLFNLIMGLFASMGYAGGLGIIFAIPVWITCLLALIAAFVCDDHANLDLKLSCSMKDVKSGTVIGT